MKKMFIMGALSLGALTFTNTLTASVVNTPYSGANINWVKLDVSSFCKAIMKGDLEMVNRMIDLGEDINQKSVGGMTPAMFAAKYNKAEILKLLIDKGAKLNAKSKEGFTAKKYAKLSKASDALAVLEAQS
jgi:ankyrin repeat protein